METQLKYLRKSNRTKLMLHFQRMFITILLIEPSIVSAQNRENLTLEQAIEVGLRNNYSIIISKNEAEITENNAALGNAGFLPTVDVNSGASQTIFSTRQNFANGQTSERDGAKTTSISSAIALNWTIFDGFNMFTSYKQFGELKDIGEINSRIAVETTLAQIIGAYYNIVQQQQLLRALQDAILISKERTAIAEGKYKIGAGSRLEWNRAKVDLIADSSAYLRREAIWSNSKIELNRLLAREGNIQFDIADSIDINSNLAFEYLKTMTLEQNNTLKLAQKNVGLAGLSLREIQAERYPELSLNLGYDFSRFESDAGFFLLNRNLRFNYGLTLSWNLFDGFNTKRKTQNAQIEIQNSELELKDILSQIEADLAKVYKRYRISLQVVKLEEENVQLARQNLDIALQQFRLGSITSVDLREVQNNFVDSETRFTVAQLEAKLAETELLRLSGQLVR